MVKQFVINKKLADLYTELCQQQYTTAGIVQLLNVELMTTVEQPLIESKSDLLDFAHAVAIFQGATP